MRKKFHFSIISLLLIAGCSADNRPHSFVMDHPVEASRLSLSGRLVADVDCDNYSMVVISDTSNGIFSRHVKKRLKNLCYRQSGVKNVNYVFTAPRTPAYDMIATQPQRIPEF